MVYKEVIRNAKFMSICSAARRRTHPGPRFYATPLPDVWRTTRSYQRQHQLTHQHCGSTCKWRHVMERHARAETLFLLAICSVVVSWHLNSDGFLTVIQLHNFFYPNSMLLCLSSAGISGALAKPRSGSGWRTNRRPEPPRLDSGRPISARQIPHHQIGLVSSHFN